MLFAGADPDIHKTAVAIIDDSCKIAGIWCIKAQGSKGRDAVLAMIAAYGPAFEEMHHGFHGDSIFVFAVEAQELYHETTDNPRSVALLGPLSGALLANATMHMPDAARLFPAPQAWKGTAPKHIHQSRVLNKVGLEHKVVHSTKKLKSGKRIQTGYAYPTAYTTPGVNQGDWKHVTDAIGLALFAREEYHRIKAFTFFRKTLQETPP